MKKILLSSIMLAITAVAGVFVLSKNYSAKDKLLMENVEALADLKPPAQYWCCFPYDVSCVEAPGLVVWGTLSKKAC